MRSFRLLPALPFRYKKAQCQINTPAHLCHGPERPNQARDPMS